MKQGMLDVLLGIPLALAIITMLERLSGLQLHPAGASVIFVLGIAAVHVASHAVAAIVRKRSTNAASPRTDPVPADAGEEER